LTEILEYALVFLVSALVASASVGFYSAYASALAGSRGVVDFSSLDSSALASIKQGVSSVTISVSNATIECYAGTLSLLSPTYNASANIPAGCSFQDDRLTGTHTFIFTSEDGQLGVVVR